MSKHVVGKDLGEVQIGEYTWRVRPLTRSAAKASSELRVIPQEDLDKHRSFEEVDEEAKQLINYIDKRLGGESSAGAVLLERWEADEVGLDDLTALSVFLSEAGQNGDGPPQ